MKKHLFIFGDLLIVIAIVVIIGLLLKYQSPPAIRFFMSVIFIFYCPGYTLLAALYPDNRGISNLQRFFASIGSSLVVTSLLLLSIAYTLGIRITTIYITISLFLVLMSGIAFLRRRKLKESSIYKPFGSLMTNPLTYLRENSHKKKLDTIIIITTIILILFSAGHLLWVTRGIHPQYSELFLLGKGQMAAAYPENAKPGDVIHFTVGVIHHGKQAGQYLLTSQLNGEKPNPENTQTFFLDPEEEKKIDISIKLRDIEAIQKVSFSLYTIPQHELRRELHFWINTYPNR